MTGDQASESTPAGIASRSSDIIAQPANPPAEPQKIKDHRLVRHLRAIAPSTHALLESRWTWRVIFGLAGILGAAITLNLGSGTFFYQDDFAFIQSRENPFLFTLIPYNGHMNFSGGLVWITILQVFGASSHLPYLVLSVVLTLISACAVFALIGRIATPVVGVAFGIWLIFLGPAYHNQLWGQASLSMVATIMFCVICIALTGERRRSRDVVAVAAAVFALGSGGMGFAVPVSLLVILLLQRRWRLSITVAVGLAAAGMVELLPMSGSGGEAGRSLLSNALRIPGYLPAVLQETLRLIFGIPEAMAGAAALATLILFATVVATMRFSPTSLANVTALGSICYLAVTWTLTGIVRGVEGEIAAPRYIGVTGPILAAGILAAVLSISSTMSESITPQHWLRTGFRTRYIAAALLILVSIANTPQWLQSRRDSSYLGSVNMGRVSALHAGADWIDPNFNPGGDGMGSVVQSELEAGWLSHGMPDLAPQSLLKSQYPSAGVGAFVDTALKAGLVVSLSDRGGVTADPGACQKSVTATSNNTITYWGASEPLSLSTLGSAPVQHLKPQEPGAFRLQPMSGIQEWTVAVAAGCLAME